MKITKTEIKHTGLVDVGRFAFYIYFSKDGVEIDNKMIIEQASHFPCVVLTGEPIEQNEDAVKLVKGIVNNNMEASFIIHTNGMIKPTGFNSIDNITYTVHMPISGDINKSSVRWFEAANARFLFRVNDEDDADRANLIINEHDIRKKLVYLVPGYDIRMVSKIAKRYGYNIAPDFFLLFNEEEDDKNDSDQ